MRQLLLFVVALVSALPFTGCVQSSGRRVVGSPDVTPPEEPREVYSVTGDGTLTLYWSPPRDRNLAGYSVFISEDDQDYYLIDNLGASARHLEIEGDRLPSNVPFEFVNGNTYFLGVAAHDAAGNESDLTASSTTFDTPRPAGRDLVLFAVNGPRASESGYDFSRSPYGYAMPGMDLFADVYFAIEGGRAVMRTAHPEVVEVQNLGGIDFDAAAAGWLDESDWLPTSHVNLALGDVVLLKIFEATRPGNSIEPFHVAKFQVVGLWPDRVMLDWAYQIAPNNRELKPTVSAFHSRGTKQREVL